MAGLNLFTNNAATTLATGINSSVTSLDVAAATGGLFPNPTAGQYFYCTLSNAAGTTIEIVKVTARSTDTFTIVRGQDNTTAASFSAGDKVELRLTAADLQNFPQLDSTNTFSQAQTFSTAIAATSGGTGQSTYATGDILYASASNTLSKLTAGSNGQVLTLASGVPSWAAAGGSSSMTITDFTATAGQTSFTVSYTVGLVEGVYRNGIKLGTADYTATTGTTIVLGTGATAGDLIQVVAFSAIAIGSVVNSISFGSTGLTPSTATNGTVTVAGTLAIANGGTNNGSLAVTAGGVVYTDGSKLVNVGAGSSGQVLQSNGASAPSWVAASAGGLGGITVFTSSGTFTIPSGKTVVKVTVVGGGGGGGGGNGGGGGGGGAGGACIKYLTGVTPGNTLTVTRGAGGAGGGNFTIGTSGGTSSVSSGTQTITTLSATGGSGGNRQTYSAGGGEGGIGSNGDLNIGGQGGGSSGGLTVCGNAYANGGLGGNSIYGGGARGSCIDDNAGLAAQNYGGGGSGNPSTGTAGAGSNGVIVFEY